MLDSLKHEVCEANHELFREGLVTLTWGNASACDRAAGALVIKPSGVPYQELQPQQMVVVSLESGTVIEGSLRPSSDTPTHLALYRAFHDVGGIVHSHSTSATVFAQACHDLPCLGTTHADQFAGTVPLAPALTPGDVERDYEGSTGKSIIETFAAGNIDPMAIPAVLCAHHGPFAWGGDVNAAVHNAVALEHVARMALQTLMLEPDLGSIPRHILSKHYSRKHGPRATYGQSGGGGTRK